MHPYLTEMIDQFQRHSDVQRAIGAKAYLLNQFDFFGLPTPLRRKLCKEFYKNHPITNHRTLSVLIKESFHQPQRELHYFAIELLGYHHKLWCTNTIPLIEWMITHKSWWDSVDSTNSHVIGKFFQIHPECMVECTTRWNQSKNIWLQRMSILFQLSYKSKTNKKLLTLYIENCELENNFFIRKAIGWALRSYAYTNPKWVIQFVQAHPKLSPLSKREALKHQL